MIYHSPLNSHQPVTLILGNGLFPPWFDINQMLAKHSAQLVCADGGADKARQIGLFPDLIIGDLDSAATETLADFRQANVDIKFFPGQENNDLEKCIRYLMRRGQQQLILAGFTGRRDDQTIATYQIVRKYMGRVQFLIITETAEIYPLCSGAWQFETVPGQIVSLFGFERARQVTTDGLQFPLKAENLSAGSRGLSNIARRQVIKIRFASGKLLVVQNRGGS